MTIDLLHLLHQTLFGGIAAAGFGILFNFGLRDMPWCFFCGALTLCVRTLGLDAGWSLEAATFVAAVSITTLVSGPLHRPLGTASTMFALAGCIPMVPGFFMAQSILGLFAITAPNAAQLNDTIITSIQYMLRVLFTIGAIGAGITIPTHILRTRDF